MSDSSSDPHMNFCESCGADFTNSDVDAESGEEDRCQGCIRYMRLESSPSAMEAWFERKIKRKAKTDNISEEQARANFSWDVEDWRHESSSDVDVDSDDGAEEAVAQKEGRGLTRKRGFEVVGEVGTDDGRTVSDPDKLVPIQQDVTEKGRPVKRARLREVSPRLQGNTNVIEKSARQQKELVVEGGRVLRSGKSYRYPVSLNQDAGYDADAEERMEKRRRRRGYDG